jgi:hypothetical protein
MPVVSHNQKRKKWLTAGWQFERAMRLRPVQEDRHAGNRDVRERQRHDEVPPPWKGHQSVRDEAEKIEGHQQSFVFRPPREADVRPRVIAGLYANPKVRAVMARMIFLI